MKLNRALLLAGAAAWLALGCNSSSTTTASTTPEAAVAVDEVAAANNDAAWSYAVADTFTDPFLAAIQIKHRPIPRQAVVVFDPVAAANTMAASAANYYSPSSCVTATANGAVATLKFNGCNGPVGLTELDGTLVATYSSSSAGPQFVLTSNGLTISGVPYDVNATGVISRNGNTRVVTLDSTSVRSSSTATRTWKGTVAWTKGNPCLTVNGTGTQTLNGSAYATTLNGYQRCSGQCPTAGTLTSSGPNGGVATLTFNNSATPGFTDSNGANGAISISCP
ncbi:MAG: hypothetical protein JST54_30160 [Deltaproteobacteria bacterium]|nr:hypothetical protein [Deltaproteobacteria bacterium]